MTRNDAQNVLLMIGVGLLLGSLATTVSLAFIGDAGTALISGAIAAAWGAAMVAHLCRYY